MTWGTLAGTDEPKPVEEGRAVTPDEQRRLARDLDAHVQHLRRFAFDGARLLHALSGRLPEMRALMAAAGPGGMGDLARRHPGLALFAELLDGLPRAARAEAVASSASSPAGPEPRGGGARPAGQAALDPLDAYRCAKLLLDRHGEGAELVVAMRADELDGQGDEAGRRAWMRILAALDELRRMAPRPGERIQ